MLNVWIGNLGKYNEGELVGEWLELPVSKKELDTFLREKVGLQLTQEEVNKLLAENGVCYEEYMINDYETDLPNKDKIKNADKQNEKDDYSISTREIGTATMGIAIGSKKTGQKILRADAQQDLTIQQG